MVFNPTHQKISRRTLRKNLTAPEQRLWQRIRNKQLGVKFRRQHGIGNYIADFYCPECRLVIELDGESHYSADAKSNDQIRDEFMKALNLQVLRFTNTDVMENIDGVLSLIVASIDLRLTPS